MIEPFISANKNIKELTFHSIAVGIVFSFFFAIANTYLGLKIGQTVSASIPAAVLSLGLSRAFFRGRTTVLEHNIVQTIATMGEGMAGGIVFALPALLLLGDTPSLFRIFLLSLLGGVLGIVFMIPMRRFLIVEEHKKLPYPEGTACAEILMASARKGKNAVQAVYGFAIAGVYKVLMNALFLWNEVPTFMVRLIPGARLAIDGTPALLGLGYIIGFNISTVMVAGGLLAWVIIIPLIVIFGGQSIIYPGTTTIASMSSDDIWSHYIRYIGAGAVGTGGIFHLIRVIPLLGKAFRDGIKELLKKHKHHEMDRTDRDISMKWLIIVALAVAIVLYATPYLSFNLFSVILLLVLSLFFVAISSIACGVVGSSSSPVSGMLITVLLIICCVYLGLGWTERAYLFAAITLSVVACVAIGLATNTSQDLKAGFLLGSTPWKQQISQLIGLILPALIIGITVTVLNKAYSIGSALMPAPQATLLAMIAQGVMEKTLPFGLVSVGIVLAAVLALLRIPVIPFAIGLYLPLELSSGIFVGGFIRLIADWKASVTGGGTIFASGLVGGDALLGVIIALLTVAGFVPLSAPYFLPNFAGPILYFALAAFTYAIAKKSA